MPPDGCEEMGWVASGDVMYSSTFYASNAEARKHLRLIQEAARHMTDRIVDPCHVHKSDPLAWATTDTRSERGACLDFASASGGRREPDQSYQYESGSPGLKIAISRIPSMSATMV